MKNPRVLRDFERRLEGAVEGFFARAFRSGLQPVELAKGLGRYAEEQRQVTDSGIIAPNAFRFTVNPKDADRLAGFGDSLITELEALVMATVTEQGASLAGEPQVKIDTAPDVAYGMFRLVGRIDADAVSTTPAPSALSAATDAPAEVQEAVGPSETLQAAPTAPAAKLSPAAVGTKIALHVVLPDGTTVPLAGSRLVVGRLDSSPITLNDSTVSRDHAAFVNRGGIWWVLDLGSTNGTRINGRSAAEHPVKAGDQVEFGEVLVEVAEA